LNNGSDVSLELEKDSVKKEENNYYAYVHENLRQLLLYEIKDKANEVRAIN
jgi:hypothetical protein